MPDRLVPSMLIEASGWQGSVKARSIIVGCYSFFELINDEGAAAFALEIREYIYASDVVAIIASGYKHVAITIDRDAHVTRCDSLPHVLKAVKVAEEIDDGLWVVFRIDARTVVCSTSWMASA